MSRVYLKFPIVVRRLKIIFSGYLKCYSWAASVRDWMLRLVPLFMVLFRPAFGMVGDVDVFPRLDRAEVPMDIQELPNHASGCLPTDVLSHTLGFLGGEYYCGPIRVNHSFSKKMEKTTRVHVRIPSEFRELRVKEYLESRFRRDVDRVHLRIYLYLNGTQLKVGELFQIATLFPFLGGLDLTGAIYPEEDLVTALPLMRGLSSLTLGNQINSQGKVFGSMTRRKQIEAVAKLDSLRRLKIIAYAVRNQEISRIRKLRNLRSLHVEFFNGYFPMEANDINWLSELKELRSLTLKTSETSEWVSFTNGLSELRSLPHLRTLTLEVNDITRAGIENLAHLQGLVHLRLSHRSTRFPCVGFITQNESPVADAILYAAAQLRRLKTLTLTTPVFGTRAVRLLGELSQIKVIKLNSSLWRPADESNLYDNLRSLGQMKRATVRLGKNQPVNLIF
jgi:hypothetical protein